MKVVPELAHPWDLSPGDARAIQEQLRSRVQVRPLTGPVGSVAGVDVSVREGVCRAAIVTLSFPALRALEAATAELPVSFPYVPGLLAFREGPVVLLALGKLKVRPDVIIFDAQGLAHPRRLGLAAHLGVLLDRPSIGCAKSRLCGRHEEPRPERGSWVPLTDDGTIIGAVVRTRSRVRPVYVSIGHQVDLESAVDLVLRCCTRYRLPEPIRWAHRVAGGTPLPEQRE
jgi:deoxyribonuclease V